MDKRPIGVFDSGVGGLSVVKRIRTVLPNENIVYVGDTLRIPYGEKNPDVVLSYAREIIAFLENIGVKLIVIACNTVTSWCLETLQKESKTNIIGVISPGTREANDMTKSGRVGLIATTKTVESGAHARELVALNRRNLLIAKSAPPFVYLVENNELTGEHTDQIVKDVLAGLLAQHIDTLILGCTHYPMLLPSIEKATAGFDIVIIDPAIKTAEEAADFIHTHHLQNDGEKQADKFFVSGDCVHFSNMSHIILGTTETIESVAWK